MNAARVLVIIFGELRGSHLAWKSTRTHVIDNNQADLAFIGPEPPASERAGAQVLLQKVKYNWSIPEQDDWGEFLEKNVVSDADSGWRALCKHYDPSKKAWEQWNFLGGTRSCQPPLSGGILFAYRHILYQHLVQDKLTDRYDWFIFTRSDYLYLCSPPRPSLLPRGRVYLPRGERYGGYTDRFAIVPSELALTFFNVTNDLLHNWRYWDSLKKQRDFSGNIESALAWYITRMQIPITLYCHPGFTVRKPDDPSSWYRGTGVFPNQTSKHPDLARLNLSIKYPMEVVETEEACSPWRKFRHWSTHEGADGTNGDGNTNSDGNNDNSDSRSSSSSSSSNNSNSNSNSRSSKDSTGSGSQSGINIARAEVTDLLSLVNRSTFINRPPPAQKGAWTLSGGENNVHADSQTGATAAAENKAEAKAKAKSAAEGESEAAAKIKAKEKSKAEIGTTTTGAKADVEIEGEERHSSSRRHTLAAKRKSYKTVSRSQSKSKKVSPTKAPNHLVREVC